MTILRSSKDIEAASTADLVETYNAMAGKNIKKFSSRAAGELQVANALMAAADAAGHLGVPKGKTPQPMTVTEIAVAEAAKRALGGAAPAHDVATSAQKPAKTPESPKGSLRASLAAKAGDAKPNQPKPKPEKKEATGERAPKIVAVAPTGAGRTKLQAGSKRNEVMATIVSLASASKGKPVTLAAIEEVTGYPVNGYVGKLIVTGHVAAATPEAK